MTQALVSISDYPDAFTAEAVRIRLEAAGIRAIVTGTDAATALSMGGAPSNRLVRVEVAQGDYVLAVATLRADAQRLLTAQPWICSRCDESNEPAFDFCWSCDKARSAEDPIASRLDDHAVIDDSPPECHSLTDLTPPSMLVPDDLNPYRPSTLVDQGKRTLPPNDLQHVINDQDRAEVRRAFLASIVGVLVLPPLVSFYSVSLLLRLPRATYHERSLRPAITAAWLINLVCSVTWTIIWVNQIA